MRNISLIIVLVSMIFSSCSSNDNNEGFESLTLTQEEINDLSFLREEEKLARDVYIYAYNKYQLIIFNSISNSEQSHMNSVLNLMNTYDIPDSASSEIGVFNNSELQEIYYSLIALVDISSVDALTVGAIIEDLDINDIDHFINNTTKQDLLDVYDNLTCGSKNHIRSYTNQLEINGVTYAPQYISIEYYTEILSESIVGC
ncbi:MAG: DUF2202 domain-containing protein [Flavobacteriaceae bacterium]